MDDKQVPGNNDDGGGGVVYTQPSTGLCPTLTMGLARDGRRNGPKKIQKLTKRSKAFPIAGQTSDGHGP